MRLADLPPLYFSPPDTPGSGAPPRQPGSGNADRMERTTPSILRAVPTLSVDELKASPSLLTDLARLPPTDTNILALADTLHSSVRELLVALKYHIVEDNRDEVVATMKVIDAASEAFVLHKRRLQDSESAEDLRIAAHLRPAGEPGRSAEVIDKSKDHRASSFESKHAGRVAQLASELFLELSTELAKAQTAEGEQLAMSGTASSQSSTAGYEIRRLWRSESASRGSERGQADLQQESARGAALRYAAACKALLEGIRAVPGVRVPVSAKTQITTERTGLFGRRSGRTDTHCEWRELDVERHASWPCLAFWGRGAGPRSTDELKHDIKTWLS